MFPALTQSAMIMNQTSSTDPIGPYICIVILEGINGLPRYLSGKESSYQCRRWGFDPWVGKIPWRREWQPTPVLLPGESHGQRSLVGYSP